MLQLMVRRLRQTNWRFLLRHTPPAVKLANTLVWLAENYGEVNEEGAEIFNIPHQDLADVSDISVEQTSQIIEKLHNKGWLKIDAESEAMYLVNLKQLNHLADHV
jgi:CRP-like cAMP-binding protein